MVCMAPEISRMGIGIVPSFITFWAVTTTSASVEESSSFTFITGSMGSICAVQPTNEIFSLLAGFFT